MVSCHKFNRDPQPNAKIKKKKYYRYKHNRILNNNALSYHTFPKISTQYSLV